MKKEWTKEKEVMTVFYKHSFKYEELFLEYIFFSLVKPTIYSSFLERLDFAHVSVLNTETLKMLLPLGDIFF